MCPDLGIATILLQTVGTRRPPRTTVCLVSGAPPKPDALLAHSHISDAVWLGAPFTSWTRAWWPSFASPATATTSTSSTVKRESMASLGKHISACFLFFSFCLLPLLFAKSASPGSDPLPPTPPHGVPRQCAMVSPIPPDTSVENNIFENIPAACCRAWRRLHAVGPNGPNSHPQICGILAGSGSRTTAPQPLKFWEHFLMH